MIYLHLWLKWIHFCRRNTVSWWMASRGVETFFNATPLRFHSGMRRRRGAAEGRGRRGEKKNERKGEKRVELPKADHLGSARKWQCLEEPHGVAFAAENHTFEIRQPCLRVFLAASLLQDDWQSGWGNKAIVIHTNTDLYNPSPGYAVVVFTQYTYANQSKVWQIQAHRTLSPRSHQCLLWLTRFLVKYLGVCLVCVSVCICVCVCSEIWLPLIRKFLFAEQNSPALEPRRFISNQMADRATESDANLIIPHVASSNGCLVARICSPVSGRLKRERKRKRGDWNGTRDRKIPLPNTLLRNSAAFIRLICPLIYLLHLSGPGKVFV